VVKLVKLGTHEEDVGTTHNECECILLLLYFEWALLLFSFFRLRVASLACEWPQIPLHVCLCVSSGPVCTWIQ